MGVDVFDDEFADFEFFAGAFFGGFFFFGVVGGAGHFGDVVGDDFDVGFGAGLFEVEGGAVEFDEWDDDGFGGECAGVDFDVELTDVEEVRGFEAGGVGDVEIADGCGAGEEADADGFDFGGDAEGLCAAFFDGGFGDGVDVVEDGGEDDDEDDDEYGGDFNEFFDHYWLLVVGCMWCPVRTLCSWYSIVEDRGLGRLILRKNGEKGVRVCCYG